MKKFPRDRFITNDNINIPLQQYKPVELVVFDQMLNILYTINE